MCIQVAASSAVGSTVFPLPKGFVLIEQDTGNISIEHET